MPDEGTLQVSPHVCRDRIVFMSDVWMAEFANGDTAFMRGPIGPSWITRFGAGLVCATDSQRRSKYTGAARSSSPDVGARIESVLSMRIAESAVALTPPSIDSVTRSANHDGAT